MHKNIWVGMIIANICFLSGLTYAGEVAKLPPKLETEKIYRLIKDKGYRCLECHDVDKRLVGPSWKEVASNRKGHKWAHELLTFKISRGSVGEYGTAEMPHNEVQEEDVKTIVDFILSLEGLNP